MGLLDDAIRQHLDLKRRHGAHPSDVAKLEREAFGPPELAEPVAMPDAADPAAYETTRQAVPAYDEADVQLYDEEELHGEEEWAAGTPRVAPAPEVSPPAEPPVERGRAAPIDPATVEPAPPAFAPAPEREPGSLRPGGSVPLDEVGERTVEHSSLADEPDPQPDAEPGEHDELEETPEFLQETPEHDRLWFEQKPPRDFDF